MYQKDHLFNSNPGWDFGAFRHLEILVKQTNFNSTRCSWASEAQKVPDLDVSPPQSHHSSPFLRFAHVFSERGKYVLVDSVVPEWSTVVVVSEEGTECNPRSSVFQPMTPEQLVRHGIVKQHRLNLLPDWRVIIGVYHDCQTDIFDFHPLGCDDCKIKIIVGILSLLLVAVVVVTITVLVLRPGKVKLVSHWRTKPKWRSLGEPFCPGDCVCSGEGYKLMLSFTYMS